MSHVTFRSIKQQAHAAVQCWKYWRTSSPPVSALARESDNMRFSLSAAALVQAVTIVTASEVELDKRLDNGLGLTPPMGWSSWVRLPNRIASLTT